MFALFAVTGVLLLVGIEILVRYHLDTVRLQKRLERDKQRDADKLEAKRKYGGTRVR